MRCGGQNMNIEDLPSWIAMYGTLTSDLFKSNVALTYDNVGKTMHALYAALWYPLDISMLTCITAAVRMGTHILHPYMVMRDTLHTLNRSRVEAWWRIHKFNNRSEASRDDIETVVFGSTGSNPNADKWPARENAAVENGVPIDLTRQQLEVSCHAHPYNSHLLHMRI